MGFDIASISEPTSSETPIHSHDIEEIIKSQLTDLKDPNALSTIILEEITKKSSKHKFIVQTTKISLEDNNVNLDIATKFAAAWESEKDGHITVKLVKTSNNGTSEEVPKGPETVEEDEDREVKLTETEDDSKRSPPERQDTIGGILDDYVTVESQNHEQYLVSIFYVFVG